MTIASPREPTWEVKRVYSMRTHSAAAAEVSRLYAAEAERLIRMLVAIGSTRTDAEDIAQDSFARLLANWKKVGSYQDPVAWLRRVAINLQISAGRQATVRRRTLGRLAAFASKDAYEIPEGDAISPTLTQSLSLDHRRVLVLHYGFDMSVAEMALVLGLSKGTIKSRLARARAHIQTSLIAGENS